VARAEAGESLTEVLMTLIILTTAIVAILTALMVVVRTAALNKEKARSAVAVQTAIERIEQPVESSTGTSSYVACGGSTTPLAAYQARLNSYLAANTDTGLTNYSITITGVRYAQGSWSTATPPVFTATNASGGLNSFGTSCPGQRTVNGVVRDGGVQEVTVKVASSASASYQVNDTLVIVKRDATCPVQTNYSNVDLGPC
jgi:Tfp pilus assembly protein PilX